MRTYASVSPVNRSEMRILTWSVFLNRGVRPLTHKDVMNFQVADRPALIFSRSWFLVDVVFMRFRPCPPVRDLRVVYTVLFYLALLEVYLLLLIGEHRLIS